MIGGALSRGLHCAPHAGRRLVSEAPEGRRRSDVCGNARSGFSSESCSHTELGSRARGTSFHLTSLVTSFGDTASTSQPLTPFGRRGVIRTVPHAEAGATSGVTPARFDGVSRSGAFLSALYQFTRPHTMAGTFISVVSISVMALQGLPFGAAAANGLTTALVSALLMNVFIVGLNQVYDVEIDKINKPYLPLASGEFSMRTGLVIIGVTLVLSLGVGVLSGSPPLMATLVVSMLLGIAYSTDLPLLRWKKNAFVAACCVMAIRAIAVQLGFFFHMQRSIGVYNFATPKPLLITVFLMFFFAAVIALFKDIPDVRGDNESGVQTFSVRMGEQKVFWICIWMLTAMYAGAIGMGLTSKVVWSRIAFPCTQALMIGILWKRAREMKSAQKQDFVGFYMFIWQLFYSEYFCIPLLR
ncbi:hypothetical protein BSKO_03078 [Bryopsis sp. KO-2023]|nr:hypothetical protein BSKO_03078 [Bryopsis sp. KO-2023]